MKKKLIIALFFIIEIYAIKGIMAANFNPNNYIGVYYLSSPSSTYDTQVQMAMDAAKNMTVYKEFQRTGTSVTIKQSELDKWINGSPNSYVKYGLKKYSEEQMKQYISLSNQATSEKIKEALEKEGRVDNLYYYTVYESGKIIITDDSGTELGRVPKYVVKRHSATSGSIDEGICSHNEPFRLLTNTMKTYNSTEFWGAASNWFQKGQENQVNLEQTQSIIEQFETMINVVGTAVIIVATIVLGIRYIIGTVDSKVSAKEGLITLLVACIFFFGWTSISNLLFPGNQFVFTQTNGAEDNYQNMVGKLFSTFTYFANIVVIICIIYVGVKYILAGAEGRSELKGRSIFLIIGIILAFATTNVLTFISNVIQDTL